MNATPSGTSVPLRKTGCAVSLLLVVLRVVLLQRPDRCTTRSSWTSAAGELEAAVAVERIDAEGAAAADGARRDRQVAADERRERRIVEHAAELPVEELRLRVALQRVLEAPRQVDVRQRQRAVLRDRRGEDVELLVAEHVAEGDLRCRRRRRRCW